MLLENDARWDETLRGMFEECQPIQDCTPKTLLEVLKAMPRKTNRLGAIQSACFARNINNADEAVLNALRKLYQSGAIEHKAIQGVHCFIVI